MEKKKKRFWSPSDEDPWWMNLVFTDDSILTSTMHIQTMAEERLMTNQVAAIHGPLKALIHTFHQLHEWTLSGPHVIYIHS